ncbi:MAG: hypothetical protein NUV77_01875 [Thermoguttaceae bacterium]|jgi:hypothetical protein|nr:hypothetical protein [Thermoguttaceae bacterium]
MAWRIAVGWSIVGCCFFLVLVGCGRKGPPRKETFPVRGTLVIDGRPVGNVAVRCVSVQNLDASTPPSATFTRDDGTFEISTYEKSDGVPEGEYVLTFEWGELNLVTRTYGGDKLGGRYRDAKQSKFRFKVEKGKPVDLGRIELTTK